MSVYLDASVIIPIFNVEAGTARVDHFMRQVDEPVIVSDFAAAEVAATFSRLIRTRTLERQDGQDRLADFDAWRASFARDIDVQASDIRLANAFVRRFELMLRAPDALHAAICQRSGLVLATLDRRLATAAKALGLVVAAL